MKIGDWIINNWTVLMAPIFFTSFFGFMLIIVYSNREVALMENQCQQGVVVRTTEGWRCIDAKVIE